MKARVQTKLDKLSLLEKIEIARVNKLWYIALNQEFGFGKKRLERVYAEVCDIAGQLYESPEHWIIIDERLEKLKANEYLPPEDINEREEIARAIHKANGKKWRV